MRMRLWAAEGFLGSAVALILTYLLVEPEPFVSRYAGVIGWSTITVFLIKWGGMRSAMSIVVTVFPIIHGFFFSFFE